MTLPPDLEKIFDKLGKSIDSVIQKTTKDLIPREDFAETEKELKKIKTAFESLGTTYDQLKNSDDKKLASLLPEDTVEKLKKIATAYANYVKNIKKVIDAEREH
jgi:hypothetical protein